MTPINNLPFNASAWNNYSPEYYKNVRFTPDLIHLGLGLEGLNPAVIYHGDGNLLDVGCGNGFNTNIFANQAPSSQVIGIDGAETAIESANGAYKLPNLYFYTIAYENLISSLNLLSVSSFRYITFIGSLDYIELNEVFFETLNRLTTTGSRCFISKFHPFWTTLFDNDTQKEQVKSYFNSGSVSKIQYGSREQCVFNRYHYSLTSLFSVFNKAGWHAIRFEEPKPDIDKSDFRYTDYETDDTLMQRLSTIPMTIILEFMRN
jgi:SAM-dependent methyltransferase